MGHSTDVGGLTGASKATEEEQLRRERRKKRRRLWDQTAEMKAAENKGQVACLPFPMRAFMSVLC